MRKLFALVLGLALMAGLAACGAAPAEPAPYEPEPTTQAPLPRPEFPGAPEDFTGMDEAALAPYLALAEEALRSYVADEPFPLPMSELLEFTMARREHRGMVVGQRAHRMTIGTDVYAWEVIDGKLLVTVSLGVEYSWRDGANDITSGFGTGMQLLIEHPRAPVLIDWFCLDKFSWDRAERGIPPHPDIPDSDLRNPDNWLINHTFD